MVYTKGSFCVLAATFAALVIAGVGSGAAARQLPKRLVIADELQTSVIECEDEQLNVVPLKFTDTAGTTCLHVPALDLIAAGDATYKRCASAAVGIKPESKT